MKTAADVLKFWFIDHGPVDWFAGKPEFDAEIAADFAETHAAVARGEGWDWRSTPKGGWPKSSSSTSSRGNSTATIRAPS